MKLLFLLGFFIFLEAKLQTITIIGSFYCEVEKDGPTGYYDSDLRVSVVDHDYLSKDDVLAEGYFKDGTVELSGSTDERFEIVPKMWVDHRCGWNRTEPEECYTRTEFFIGNEWIDKIYYFRVFLDIPLSDPDNMIRKETRRCNGRRRSKLQPQQIDSQTSE
ncbi:unnamed protein product, partial [Mesorhabditis belari]|uniref:Uncharacterized protein n=1 Tax=Mesorhabditis belari TaxID=2138241 RepID=A0AAF3FP05_9BILA